MNLFYRRKAGVDFVSPLVVVDASPMVREVSLIVPNNLRGSLFCTTVAISRSHGPYAEQGGLLAREDFSAIFLCKKRFPARLHIKSYGGWKCSWVIGFGRFA